MIKILLRIIFHTDILSSLHGINNRYLTARDSGEPFEEVKFTEEVASAVANQEYQQRQEKIQPLTREYEKKLKKFQRDYGADSYMKIAENKYKYDLNPASCLLQQNNLSPSIFTDQNKSTLFQSPLAQSLGNCDTIEELSKSTSLSGSNNNQK